MTIATDAEQESCGSVKQAVPPGFGPHRACPGETACATVVSNTCMLICLQVAAELEKARFEQFKQQAQRKLQGVYCPDHHKPPRLKINGHSLHDASLSLSGCCDKLMVIANEAIANST